MLGVEDIELTEDVFMITCAVEDFGRIQKKLDEMGVKIENAQLQRIPNDTKNWILIQPTRCSASLKNLKNWMMFRISTTTWR